MTINLSPKVKWPAVALITLALAFFALWVIATGGADLSHPLFIIGCSVLGAAGVQAPLGFRAPPGEIAGVTVGPANDDLLSLDAIQEAEGRGPITDQSRESALEG